jgi:hypothetical protein
MGQHAGDVEEWVSDTRRNLCQRIGEALSSLGIQLRQLASVGPEVKVAGILSQMASDLTFGALAAFDVHRFYSFAALGRQLLEIRDLIEFFRTRPDRANFWLAASDSEMKSAKDISPGAVRNALNVDGRAYSHHCAVGGHPRMTGALLLPGSGWLQAGATVPMPVDGGTVEVGVRDALLTDLLQHLRPVVLAVIETAPLEGLEAQFEQTNSLVNDIVGWVQNDPLAMTGKLS